MSAPLPPQWREACARDVSGGSSLPDPAPERRLARLLAAFIVAGLVFLVLPGTLVGVWNLLGISSRRQADAVSAVWIQAHGHAQLFGWVGTFIVGISLYTLPKFRGAWVRSVPLGWAMLALWTSAIGGRFFTAVLAGGWRVAFPVSASLELLVALLLVWQCSRSGPSHRRGAAWEILIFAGFSGLIATLAWQLALLLRPLPVPAVPAAEDRLLITGALWLFCFPVVLGYAARLFPGLLFTPAPDRRGAVVTVAILCVAGVLYAAGAAFAAAATTTVAVAAGCWSARVFHPARRRPKVAGIDPRYPLFARLAFGWLAVSAASGMAAAAPGMLGASRHAFTVGFLATLIFAIGPRILPSFLNSRELWSPALMRASLLLLTAGCILRVTSEPLAYMGVAAAAWKVLPVSALAELAAVLIFALNMAGSLARPAPAWFGRRHVNDGMTVYWLVASYPATRRVLIENGLATLARTRRIPKSLTIREAAEADGADVHRLVKALGDFFEARLARSVRQQTEPSSR